LANRVVGEPLMAGSDECGDLLHGAGLRNAMSAPILAVPPRRVKPADPASARPVVGADT
jgi:hypothetical protein